MSINLTREKRLAMGLTTFAFAFSLFAAADPFLTLDSTVQTNGQLQFNLNGEDSVTYMIEGSSDLSNWTPILTNSDQPATRTITVDGSQNFGFYRASRGPLPLFAGAITARSNITMEGTGVYTDSYDSSDTNDFPGGLWNATNRLGNGDIAVGNGSVNSVNILNSKVMGKVSTQGGTIANVALDPQSSIGDVAWVTGGNTGWESPAYFRNDFRFCLPDVSVPYTSGLPLPPPATNGIVLSSGQYLYNGNLNIPLLVTGQVFLYITGSFSAGINIQTNASLTLVVGGSSATLSTVNNTGNALAFQYYGLPGNTNVLTGGSFPVVGTVYAPEATVTLSGSANFSGALVGNSVRLFSEVSVHYDENLARSGPQR